MGLGLARQIGRMSRMEFFGISGGELMIILVVALLVIGPESVAQGLRWFKSMVAKAKNFSARLREETKATEASIGVDQIDFSGLDLNNLSEIKGLDPRQIIREAVREEMEAWMEQTGGKTPTQSNTTHQSKGPKA